MDPKIEEFSACLDPLYIEECEIHNFENLQDATKTYMQDKEENQGSNDYIEEWFLAVFRPTQHLLRQQFLAPHQEDQSILNV